MKRVATKEKIDLKNYVNIETGETLLSENPTITSVNKINPNLVILSSEEYFVIDLDAMNYIATKFNQLDIGRIMLMSSWVLGEFNIVHNGKNDEPCSTKELQESLELTRNRFRDFMKRLYDESIIAYINIKYNGKDCKFVMMNPHLVRRKKTYHVKCTNMFKKLK